MVELKDKTYTFNKPITLFAHFSNISQVKNYGKRTKNIRNRRYGFYSIK